jgi:hypothetical protein
MIRPLPMTTVRGVINFDECAERQELLLLRISPAAADASHSQSVFMLHAAARHE